MQTPCINPRTYQLGYQHGCANKAHVAAARRTRGRCGPENTWIVSESLFRRQAWGLHVYGDSSSVLFPGGPQSGSALCDSWHLLTTLRWSLCLTRDES